MNKQILMIGFAMLIAFVTSCKKEDQPGNKWTTYTIKNGLADNWVHTITIDEQGNKWFGTGYGVTKFDNKNWTTYTTKDGLVCDYVVVITADRQGNIWFGTY